jgi:hypothetical protein
MLQTRKIFQVYQDFIKKCMTGILKLRYLVISQEKIFRINILQSDILPVSSEFRNFVSNRFDILIDINFKELFPLKCVSSASNAGFKVGIFESETIDTPYDLMMEMKNPVDVENYLNQVIHYLEMINSGTVL